MGGQAGNAVAEHDAKIDVEGFLVSAGAVLAMQAGDVPDVPSCRHAGDFCVRQGLQAFAEDALGEEVEIDFAQQLAAVGNVAGETVSRRGFLQFTVEVFAFGGGEEILQAFEGGGHFGAGEGVEIVSAVKVGDEQIEDALVIEPIAVHAHAALGAVVAVFKTLDESGLAEFVGHRLHEGGELKILAGFGFGNECLSEIVKKFLYGLCHGFCFQCFQWGNCMSVYTCLRKLSLISRCQ